MIRIGQKLREERLHRGLSLEDVAKATKIRPSFLAAIERGEYKKLPSSAYAQGFVRNYAEYLGLSKREVLALFRREFDEEKVFRVLPEGFARQKDVTRLPFRIHHTALLVVFLLLFLSGFIVFQYRYAIIQPPLSVQSPQEGLVTEKKDIQISGRTDPNAVVTINGQTVTVLDDGSFTKQLSLFPGDTIIEIRARHRLGKETLIQRRVTVKE
ncbi:MAG: helix-turn-helix domain-containing protein [Candidatus Levybacteria bacterium]|nr:helix-turn-helix domain-containing protein [Candidatus Levybacteria bacterium]